MKFIKFIMSLACIVFASYGAFAGDELILFVLENGESKGSPSSFVLNKTKKVFCTDTKCTATITKLTTLPSSSKGFYTGSAIDGSFPLIDKNGNLLMSNDLLQYVFERYGLVTGQEYIAGNLFWTGDSITVWSDESNPNTIYLNSWTDGWKNWDTEEPITQMTTLPTMSGKVFVGFGRDSNLASFRVIDRYGNILSRAAGMSGGIEMFPIWKSTIMCDNGYYLPAYKESCALCPENYWCPGGKAAGSYFETNYFEDQGINACPFGLISKAGTAYSADCYTPAAAGMIVCDPGWYLPGKAKSCYKCPNGSWCPGGLYYLKISEDGDVQGINTCPSSGPSSGASAEQSTDISQCFMEYLATIIENGKVTQTCYYGDNAYTENCTLNVKCNDEYTLVYDETGSPSCVLNSCKIDPNALESDENCIPTKCNDEYTLVYDETGSPSCVLNSCKIDPNALESDENCIPTKCNDEYTLVYDETGSPSCVLNSCKIDPNALESDENCIPTKCNDEYTLVYDETGSPSCVLNSCKIDPNALESDENCIPTKCKADYHIEDKQCVSNIATCPIENGIGRKEWMKDNILGGKWTMCTAYQCNPGYTSKRYLTNETDEPCGECRNRRDTSGNIAVSAWKDDDCVIATCMYQGELYRLDSTGNKCVQICDTAGREDITGKMIWDPLSEKCERSCNPGFTNW